MNAVNSGMSRKPAKIKTVNLEEGMPTVEQARLRMNYELHKARLEGCIAVKLIHGYGSSGAGGALRMELQHDLRKAARDGTIRAFIAGEDWRVANETTWSLLKRFPEWQVDLGNGRVPVRLRMQPPAEHLLTRPRLEHRLSGGLEGPLDPKHPFPPLAHPRSFRSSR